MNKQLTIWFNSKGEMLDHASGYYFNLHGKVSELAEDFSDRLIYDGMQDYGNNVARVYFRSAITGRRYSMFLKDFNDIIKSYGFNNNEVVGLFRFIKKGQAQGIKRI